MDVKEHLLLLQGVVHDVGAEDGLLVPLEQVVEVAIRVALKEAIQLRIVTLQEALAARVPFVP